MTQTSVLSQTQEAYSSIGVIAWSPDGTTLALGGFFEGDLAIRLYDADYNFVAQYQVDGGVAFLAWSHDSQRLAALINATNRDIQVWDIASGELTLRISQEGGSSSNTIAWNENDEYIGSVRNDVYVWDTQTGENIAHLTEDVSIARSIQTFVWYTDRETLVEADARQILRVWDVAMTRLIQEIELDLFPVSMALSPDGSQLAIGGSRGEIVILDAANLETTISTTQVSDAPLWKLEWSPLGDKLIAASSSGNISIIDTNMSEVVQIVPIATDGFLEALAFNPDGESLLYATNPYRVGSPTAILSDVASLESTSIIDELIQVVEIR